MTKIFEDLEIYGIPKSDETAILAGLLNAEPILFIGAPGCSKTELIYMIGIIMRESTKRQHPDNPEKWINCHVYDTSKLNFEDLMGFPSTKALKEDRIEFIKHSTTIWNKDFIGLDEINRCTEQLQGHFLELLRHRTCMGEPTKLKFIFSAMNPFGDTGTNEMSDAIVDRHTFFLHFPTFDKMDSETRLSIINRVGNFDSYGIRYWTGKKFKLDALKDYDAEGKLVINDYLADQGDRLFKLIRDAADLYDKVHKQYFRSISILIDNIVSRFKSEKNQKNVPVISARRAGMIARAFIAYRAADISRANMIGGGIESLSNAVTTVIMSAMPIGIDKPASADAITWITQVIKDCTSVWQTSILTEDEKNNNFTYDLYYNKDPISKLEALLSHPNVDSLAVNTAWNDLISNNIEIAALVYYTYKSTTGVIPKHILSQERILEINKYVNSINEEEIPSDHMRPWAPEFDKIIQKYTKDEPNELLATCSIMCFKHINTSAKTDTEIQLKMKSLTNLLAKCHQLVKAKKEESKTDNQHDPKEVPFF